MQTVRQVAQKGQLFQIGFGKPIKLKKKSEIASE